MGHDRNEYRLRGTSAGCPGRFDASKYTEAEDGPVLVRWIKLGAQGGRRGRWQRGCDRCLCYRRHPHGRRHNDRDGPVFFDRGVLVNEVTNAADDGYEDYIPEKPAAGIEQQIQGYLDDNGGGSVIDVDREYGGTEVELVCGGYKHELYFDAQGNRIYAKIEYGRRDIGFGRAGSDLQCGSGRPAAVEPQRYRRHRKMVNSIRLRQTESAFSGVSKWRHGIKR